MPLALARLGTGHVGQMGIASRGRRTDMTENALELPQIHAHLQHMRGEKVAQRMHRSGLELRDIQASGGALDPWVRASGGNVDPRWIDKEFRHDRDDAQGRAMVKLAQGVQLYMRDRVGEEPVDTSWGALKSLFR